MTTSNPSYRPLPQGPSILAAVGIAILFVGGRLLDAGPFLRAAAITCTVMALASGVWRVVKAGSVAGPQTLARRAFAAHLAVAMAGILVVVSTIIDGNVAGACMVGAVVFGFGGSAVLLALELLMQQTRSSGLVDLPRVQRATSTAVTIVAGLTALAGIVYGVNANDKRFDLAYAAPSAPSGATSAILDTASCGAAGEKPEVVLFFERGSTAYAEVADYFEALRALGARVSLLDQALDPALAKAMKVAKNGTVAFRCGEKVESYNVGADRDEASRKLRKLDQEVRTKLGKLTRDPQNVYVTVGHGERPIDETDKSGRTSSKNLKKLLDANNAKVKKFGIAEGSTAKVPDDANLVIVLGPQQPFLPEEAQTLAAYVKAGGAIAVFVDPPRPGSDDVDVAASLEPLLQVLGLSMGHSEVVNDKEFVKQTNTSADHAFVFSTSFGTHKAVKTLAAARGKAALLFLSAQALTKRDAGPSVSVLARSRPATWSDVVVNRAFDDGAEKRDVLDLAAAVEVKGDATEARALVVGDSDVVADTLLSNEANAVFAFEALQWLLRDDTLASAAGAAVVDDAPIRHTRDEDTVWFWGTTLLAPLAVLLTGVVVVRLRRRRRPAGRVGGVQ
jgi:hypothetical protein